MKFRLFWDVVPYSKVGVNRRFRLIAPMMEAVRTSETSVNTNLSTRCYILKDAELG
jgi:hypothetical protein